MKKHISIVFLTFNVIIFAQVGINTNNPQTKFHVDGIKDNPSTGVPTITQQSNDVAITSSGNVGLGTINPTTRLELNNGTVNGAIKIVDGNQAAGKILVSNAEGVGTWFLPNTIKKVQTGIFNKASDGSNLVVQSDNSGGFKYSNVEIKLTKGIWMINLGLTLRSNMKYEYGDWVHFKLSSSNTGVQSNGFVNLGTAQNNTSYAGLVHGSAKYKTVNSVPQVVYIAGSNNYISGSNIIEVTADTLTLYLMIENKNDEVVNYGGTTFTEKIWIFNTGNWENYIYANPL